MQCKKCNYMLWNQASRNCPACGTAFLPSDFEFTPDQVEFCCPHCKHGYLGTSSQGHLEPPEFDCINCGKHIHMNDMLLRPADLIEQARAAGFSNPWTARPRKNIFVALIQTMNLGQFQPGRLMAATPVQGGWLDVIAFASIIIVFINVMRALMLTIELSLFTFQISPELLPSDVFRSFLVLTIVLAGSFVFLMAVTCLVHMGLILTGGTQHGLGATFKALVYVMGPLFWLGIPILNFPVSLVVLPWYYACAGMAVARMQQVHPVRAYGVIFIALVALTFPLMLLISMSWGR